MSARRSPLRVVAAHAVLLLIAAAMLLPFLWMIIASLRTNADIQAGDVARMVAAPSHPDNYLKVFGVVPFARYYFNSVLVAAWVTFLQCLTCSLAAFAFARLRWPGRDQVFKLYLATLMIPGVVTMIPNFNLMVSLGLLDSYLGLIVPASFSAFGTFLMRQFMLTIPTAIDEAATIDGAGPWRLFWDIVLPLARPGLITLAIFTFLGNYGSFFWPLVLIKSEHLRTLPIGMLAFDSTHGTAFNLLMAASVMNIVPLIILFVSTQKFLVKGIQLGGVKG
jgi:multiple sugar transport system permease protein